MGSYENAAKVYGSCLKNHVDENVEMVRVVCWFMLGQWQKALSAMKKLVLMNPESLQHRFCW